MEGALAKLFKQYFGIFNLLYIIICMEQHFKKMRHVNSNGDVCEVTSLKSSSKRMGRKLTAIAFA